MAGGVGEVGRGDGGGGVRPHVGSTQAAGHSCQLPSDAAGRGGLGWLPWGLKTVGGHPARGLWMPAGPLAGRGGTSSWGWPAPGPGQGVISGLMCGTRPCPCLPSLQAQRRQEGEGRVHICRGVGRAAPSCSRPAPAGFAELIF